MAINNKARIILNPKNLVILISVISLLFLGKYYLDKKHKSYCLNVAIQSSNQYLISKGYHLTQESTWVDTKENLPLSKVETADERYQSNIYNDCLKFKVTKIEKE